MIHHVKQGVSGNTYKPKFEAGLSFMLNIDEDKLHFQFPVCICMFKHVFLTGVRITEHNHKKNESQCCLQL